MSSQFTQHWILKATTSLLFPAVLIVGAHFITNSKIETQATAFHQVEVKKFINAQLTNFFEADEEFEDDTIADSSLLSNDRATIDGAIIPREGIFIRLDYSLPFQIGLSLNPRAPPAL